MFKLSILGRFLSVPMLISGCISITPLQTALANHDDEMSAQAELNFPRQQSPGLLTPAPAEITPENPDRKPVPLTTAPEQEEIHLDVPAAPAAQQSSSHAFAVMDVVVEGSTMFKPEDFEPLTASYEGRDVSLEELGKVVEGVSQMYRDKGYLTSQAYIPPQDVENGRVVIRVQEGVYGDIEVSGNRFYRLKVIERVLSQEPGELLSIPELEARLNRINRQNPFRLRAILTAGDAPGETDLKLEVSEKLPIQVSGTFDNQGRPFIGLYRQGAEFNHQSLTGWGDRLALRWLGAEGTQVAIASYALPLNKYGTELGANFAYSGVDVELPTVRNEDIVGRAYNYGIMLSQPLGEERNWTVDLGWNWRRIQSFFFDDLTSQDDITSIQPGIQYNKFDRWGRTFIRGQMSFAPDWLGADAKFWKAETFFTRLHRLPKRNLLILRAYAQFSPDALPSAEQFQVGGAFSVRGYTEGLLIGDRGWNFGVEHRWPIPFLGHISKSLDDKIQGATFLDFGQTWLDPSSARFFGGFSNKRGQTLLAGGGVGLRVRLHRMMQGFVDFGFGMVDRDGNDPLAQPTARVHFGIRTDLAPDDYKVRGNKTVTISGKDVGKVVAFREKVNVTKPGKDAKQSEQSAPVQVGSTSATQPATKQEESAQPEQTGKKAPAMARANNDAKPIPPVMVNYVVLKTQAPQSVTTREQLADPEIDLQPVRLDGVQPGEAQSEDAVPEEESRE